MTVIILATVVVVSVFVVGYGIAYTILAHPWWMQVEWGTGSLLSAIAAVYTIRHISVSGEE